MASPGERDRGRPGELGELLDWLVAVTYAECEVEPDCLRRSFGAIWGYEGWWEPACVKHLLLAEEMGFRIWVRPAP